LQKSPQEILARQSSFFVVFPAFVAFSALFELAPALDRESGAEPRGEAVVFSCLFQLSPVRRQESCAEQWPEAPGGSLSVSPFRPMPFLFHLTLSRVRPAPLSVEQVVVQRPNLVFGSQGKKFFHIRSKLQLVCRN
jgi:hypothetical protein